MIRRIPILPTLFVLVVVALLVSLGVWQLQRRAEKHALLARYAEAVHITALAPYPRDKAQAAELLYRRSQITCASVTNMTGKAGENVHGDAGFAHYATCLRPDGSSAQVVLGWSTDPAPRQWRGGTVTGTIAPGPRLVADPPLAGLAANAAPNPSEIPDNHMSYALQWFSFAAIALAIYAIALRKQLAAGAAQG